MFFVRWIIYILIMEVQLQIERFQFSSKRNNTNLNNNDITFNIFGLAFKSNIESIYSCFKILNHLKFFFLKILQIETFSSLNPFNTVKTNVYDWMYGKASFL